MEHPTSRMSRHMWLMVLCCLIPLAALAAILVFKVPVSQTLSFGLILLCPLSHVLMMAFMGGGHGHASQPGSSAAPEGGESISSTGRPAIR